MNDKGFFYAGYSGDNVTVASTAVNAGHFPVALLNQYSEPGIGSLKICSPKAI